MIAETREELMKKFGLKDVKRPPSPVRFAEPGELSLIEQREQEADHEGLKERLVDTGLFEKLRQTRFDR